MFSLNAVRERESEKKVSHLQFRWFVACLIFAHYNDDVVFSIAGKRRYLAKKATLEATDENIFDVFFFIVDVVPLLLGGQTRLTLHFLATSYKTVFFS